MKYFSLKSDVLSARENDVCKQ